MKYIIVLTDGAADLPVDALAGKTPYEAADIKNMDYFAKHGRLYRVKTVPDGKKPGSDVANLSVMGYNPDDCYTGRSPLEAASLLVELTEEDMCFRANLVTLSDEEAYEDKTMVDYSAGEISTSEAAELINFLQEKLSEEGIDFFPGTSYRHIMRWRTPLRSFTLTPPHDISDRLIKEYLPQNDKILEIMKKSSLLLKDHPVNQKRIKEGKNPATSLWVWGEGTKPALSSFYETYGLKGAVVSAVDLLKGISECAKMETLHAEGMTGTVHTNYDGKMEAALNFLKNGGDLVYIHLEGPDECGHQGDLSGKVKAISLIDEKIIAPIKKAMDDGGFDYKFLVMPDHPTPISLKTHTRTPVPCVIYKKGDDFKNNCDGFSEKAAEELGTYIENGYEIMKEFIKE